MMVKALDYERVEKLIQEKKPKVVIAGIREDWPVSSGEIWREGEFLKEHGVTTWSWWGTPAVQFDDGEICEAWIVVEKDGSPFLSEEERIALMED